MWDIHKNRHEDMRNRISTLEKNPEQPTRHQFLTTVLTINSIGFRLIEIWASNEQGHISKKIYRSSSSKGVEAC